MFIFQAPDLLVLCTQYYVHLSSLRISPLLLYHRITEQMRFQAPLEII